ncbi:MAG TPA: hypothetical protein VL359_14695 [bacterium]|nr:hypothetical protein [bacterium]
MAGPGKTEGGRKRGRRKEKEFMDAAMDGFIRDIALQLWREYEDLEEAYDHDTQRALEELGAAVGRQPYQELWQSAWRGHVWPHPRDPQAHLFGRIEAAVRVALEQERQARAERGDSTIEDTPGYKEFVSRALNVLYREASGEIEEFD